MQKFKLINNKTKEEAICGKVTIDGFDYYVSDTYVKKLNPDDKYNTIVENPRRIVQYSKHIQDTTSIVIIATNNPNFDIPKVVDEIEELKSKWYYTQEEDRSEAFVFQYSGVIDDALEAGIILGYDKAKETYKYTEEDLISFAYFYFIEEFNSTMQSSKSTEKLLSMWKEQQITTIFYE
jgi:hypothetical protein